MNKKMKLRVAVLLVGMAIFLSITSGCVKKNDFTDLAGTWQVTARMRTGGVITRVFEFVGVGSYGDVLFEDVSCGKWVVESGWCQFFSVYSSEEAVYSENFQGDLQGKDRITGSAVFDKSIFLGEDTTDVGTFEAVRVK